MINGMMINGRSIGVGCPTYIVAEMSANHRQNYEEAVKIVRAAKEAGADAIKLQTYTPDTLTLPLNKVYGRIDGGTLWDGSTLYELYQKAYTPWEWHPMLKAIAQELKIDFFSSPFDNTAVNYLETLGGMVAYKVASFEIVDIPLIEKIASTGKPLMISTGMASLEEIKEAVSAAQKAGAKQIALLKCTSAYPAPPEEMNLRTITHLADSFHLPVGLSDHTLGISVPVAAVALGACIIEKHLTISRSIPGPDSAFSLEPGEFKIMVEAIRTAEKALGAVRYTSSAEENKNRIFRRSLFVTKDIRAGEIFTEENVRSVRPGHGLPPRYLRKVLGCRATQNIPQGTPLAWEHIQDNSGNENHPS